jgi:hypothetical protein
MTFQILCHGCYLLYLKVKLTRFVSCYDYGIRFHSG